MKSVLVVDDNELNLYLALTVLGANGYQTLSADGGQRSIEIATAEHPDLILMDIQMPRVDGYAALRQLRACASTKDIPVIALTANADEQRLLQAGFDGYVFKPYAVDTLLLALSKEFNGQ